MNDEQAAEDSEDDEETISPSKVCVLSDWLHQSAALVCDDVGWTHSQVTTLSHNTSSQFFLMLNDVVASDHQGGRKESDHNDDTGMCCVNMLLLFY